ncbi:MAG TPA: methionine synthase [Candidatus Cybelea sp.]|nr:methionine synthase [Candidatus Cybelea sp.]
MLETTHAGSLPKPAWLAKPEVLWAPWTQQGPALEAAKRDAVLVALKLQESAGIDIVTEGEQGRQHFVHGFLVNLSGIDFARKKVIGIRADRYKAECPTVTGAIRRRGSVHGDEVAFARAYTTRKLKFTLPGPMTIADTIADEHYGDRPKLAFALAEALNAEALELEAKGADVIQFDEPAFNVYLDDVREWGIAALERAAQGLKCKTAVHICYGYGIKANIDWKQTLGSEWRQYEKTFPHLAKSKIDQVSLECIHSHVPVSLMGLLKGKDVQVGAIDVASNKIETPEEVAAALSTAMEHVPVERIVASTNCGMAPMPRDVAYAKLGALAAGAALLRKQLGVRH